MLCVPYKESPFEMLESCDVKFASTILRWLRDDNIPRLLSIRLEVINKTNIFLLIGALLVFSILVIFPCEASMDKPFVLSSPSDPPYTTPDQDGFADRLAKTAFLRIGISVEISILPAERALILANEGINDGDLIRIADINRLYPNLLRVPEKMMDNEVAAFSRHVSIQTNSWAALRPYSIGYINGWKVVERNVHGAILTGVKNGDSLFKLLMNDRVDIIIYERFFSKAFILKEKLKDVRLLQPSLSVNEMFMYLHKKHKDLLIPLASALRQMKEDGTYEKIYQETLGPYLD